MQMLVWKLLMNGFLGIGAPNPSPRRSRSRKFISTLLLLMVAWLGWETAVPAQLKPYGLPDQPHARAELLADVTAIEPGRPFALGIRYEMDPEWHIYWRNSGDVGLRTQLDWILPEGFAAGPLQWPVPERVEAGGLISYAYHDEVILFAEVTPPPDLTAGEPVTLRAHSEWLVCRVECVPGEADLELTLPVGEPSPSAAAPLFAAARARLPEPVLLAPQAGPLDEDLPLAIELADENPAPAPGETRPIELRLRPEPPWQFAALPAGPTSAEIFPLVPARDWDAQHPSRTAADASRLVFRWSPMVRKQAKGHAAPANLAEAGDEDLLRIVARIPLVNPETGEERLELFTVALPATIAAGTAEAGAVAEPAADSAPAAEAATPTAAGAEPESADRDGLSFLSAPGEGPARRMSLGLLLLYAFLGGMLLNVMPCVLPVLSLKVLSFVRQGGEAHGRVLRLGLAFGAGVLASFGALALVVILLSLGGQRVGWGFQMQEPRFVIALAMIVLAFALSLFGVYSIELPGQSATKLDAAGRREGYPGAFMNGVLITALATPCTAPLLGPAIGLAFALPPPVTLTAFLAAGAGLAAPYVLLSAFPAWTRWLPRPGAWMETFKQAMGFLLLATLVWLLSVLTSLVDPSTFVRTLVLLLVVGFACWLWGLGTSPLAGLPRRATTMIAVPLLVAAAYYLLPERALARLGRQAADRPVATAPTAATANADGIPWIPFSVETLEELVARNQTVFVDFTADWCVTCQINERAVLETAPVREAIARHGVVPVKADWTLRDEAIGAVLRQLGASGVPVYVIFPAGRAHEPIVLPTVITAGLVIEKLAEATGGLDVAAATH